MRLSSVFCKFVENFSQIVDFIFFVLYNVFNFKEILWKT
nr:MAG TPA: hypothetical protein [Caudoviricetes sp.]